MAIGSIAATNKRRDAAVSLCGAQLGQQLFPTGPGLISRRPVCFAAVRIVRFAGSHEPVACTLVDDRLIFLAGRFHQLLGLWNSRIHPLVVLAVKSVNRAM